ncbi:16S rRNA (cytidine(1402)-2'-O)-methyltransferase [Spongiibacter sp. KMU-158]|uniref:Ribosomal RNA small subunit methyltransferase I n=1 Tax=Spongiibacter pelagi TaxID=2760804 RepID=A0A927GWQ9_9GAMM|nr:16S rRNA (cytidine(1402)-2'-O)-methyltransferase [Spongiibacter pelagi]MBD2859730.1 16S rRNA (cytidine(1402)-2'-O)-methyltransferase [Spongiibacter pelagi]
METPATLYVVATPLGNLGDMVPRAVEVLQSVQLIAAEDTRHSLPLMRHFGINTKMMACHDHNEAHAIERFLAVLREGGSVALISDAGTPLISDPGFRLVDAALEQGFKVSPIPGASAVIAALSAAGLPSDRFTFEGFLPAKAQARRTTLEGLAREPRTMVFYEAPHRLLESLTDLAEILGPERRVVLARELTKLFETVVRKPAAELRDWVAADANQQRGECVLVVTGYQAAADELPAEAIQVLRVLKQELPLKQASSLAAKITGLKKNQLYQYALDFLS